MPVKPQSLENHVRFVPLYHLLLTLLLLVNLGFWVRVSFLGFTGLRLAGLCVALALFLLFFYARQFAVTVQDRVIRLEMRLRMEKLLPADVFARFGEFTVGQLVALRFASDAELPALARKVLDEKIASRAEIKKLIKDWQPDYLRV